MKNILRRVVGQKNINRIKSFEQQRKENIQKKKELKARVKFYSNFVKKGDISFDVGANIGNRVEPLLKLGVNVVAVEPQEDCQKFLLEKYKNKIKLVKEGLGEKEDIKDFYISNASTISSFSEEWIASVKENRFKEYEWNQTIKVKITTLDNLIKKYGKPSFIKIDVEGYELEVLKGLSSPIKYISFEYTVPEQTHKAISCISVLKSINKDVEFNYSIGESMTWGSTRWFNTEEMEKLVQSKEFSNTDFGDIYARMIK